MEIQVARLRECLGILKPAVPRKPSLKILENVMVQEGRMVATDLATMIIVNMPEADQAFLMPYAEVIKMVEHVPGYEYLKMVAKRGKLMLDWPEGSATYPSQSLEEFPPVPDFEVKTEGDIDGDTFIAALDAALPYVATEGDRPVLSGVTVQFGAPLEVSAGDGHRMAHIVLPLQFPAEYTTILPASSVASLLHVMQKTPRTPPAGEDLMPIVLAKKQIHAALDGKRGLKIDFGPTATVIVKLVEGKPPAWLQLIPKEEPIIKVQLFARELETAVKRVANVAAQDSGRVRMEFASDVATVSARADGREVSAKISVLSLEGTPNRLALNLKYLREYLGDKDNIVTLTWTGGTAPVSLQHVKSPRVLIMPMEAGWEKDLPKAEAKPATAAAPEAPAAEKPGPKKSKAKKQHGKTK